MKTLIAALVIASPIAALNAQAYGYGATTGTLKVNRAFTITRTIDVEGDRRESQKDELQLTPGTKQFSISEGVHTNYGPCLALVGCLGDKKQTPYMGLSLLEDKMPKGAYASRKTIAQIDVKTPTRDLKKDVKVTSAEEAEQPFAIYRKTFDTEQKSSSRTEERSCEVDADCSERGAVPTGLFLFHRCSIYGTQTTKVHDVTTTTHAMVKFVGSRNEALATYSGTSDYTREEIDEASECKLDRSRR